MIIACPACSTRYAVPDSAIGVEGRTVRCAKCRHSWFQDGPELTEAETSSLQSGPAIAAPEAAVPPPPPAPVQKAAPQAAPRPAPPAVRVPEPVEPEPAYSEQAQFEAPPVAPRFEVSSPPPVYDDTQSVTYSDEGPSSFDFAPPFRPRRNWARIGTYVAVVFAVVALGLAAVIGWGGAPSWLPFPHPTFATSQTDLQLDFPPNRQDRRTLPNGSEFFGASGTVSNVGRETRYVPTILIVLRDTRDRIVYSWEVVPPKRQLKPGESITINEAVTDVPKSAKAAEIGWKPG